VKATQAGFEQAARVKGIRGWRDLLRQSYKDSQAAAGREIKRGRPKNSPAEK
jgi:hypothetical protein